MVPAKPVLLHVPAVALEKVLVACQAAACVARLGSIMQQLKRESLMLLQVDKWAAHGRAALAGEQHPGIIRTLIWQILQCGSEHLAIWLGDVVQKALPFWTLQGTITPGAAVVGGCPAAAVQGT